MASRSDRTPPPAPGYRCHWYDPQTFERCATRETTVYVPRNLDLCAAHLAVVRAADQADTPGQEG